MHVHGEVSLTGSKFQDLGLNVEGLNMAAGATVNGNWIDNLQWVRNIIILAQSDQQYDVQLSYRDSFGNSGARSLATASAATGIGWAVIPTIQANGIIGYSGQFRIKNTSTNANTFARLRVQLMGL